MKIRLGLVIFTVAAVASQLVWTNWWWVLVPLLWWCKSGESGVEIAAFAAGIWLDSMMGSTLGITSLVLVLLVTLWKAIKNQTGGGEWWMGILGVVAMTVLSLYYGRFNLVGEAVVGLLVILVARSNFSVYRSGLRLINERL